MRWATEVSTILAVTLVASAALIYLPLRILS